MYITFYHYYHYRPSVVPAPTQNVFSLLFSFNGSPTGAAFLRKITSDFLFYSQTNFYHLCRSNPIGALQHNLWECVILSTQLETRWYPANNLQRHGDRELYCRKLVHHSSVYRLFHRPTPHQVHFWPFFPVPRPGIWPLLPNRFVAASWILQVTNQCYFNRKLYIRCCNLYWAGNSHLWKCWCQ